MQGDCFGCPYCWLSVLQAAVLQPICPFCCLSTCQSVCTAVCLPACPYCWLAVCLSVCLPACVSGSVYTCNGCNIHHPRAACISGLAGADSAPPTRQRRRTPGTYRARRGGMERTPRGPDAGPGDPRKQNSARASLTSRNVKPRSSGRVTLACYPPSVHDAALTDAVRDAA